MDRNQINLLNNIEFLIFGTSPLKLIYTTKLTKSSTLKFIQNKDYINYYLLLEFLNPDLISKVVVFSKNKRSKTLKNFVVYFNFEDCSINKIKIHFKNNLSQPIEIPIEYIKS